MARPKELVDTALANKAKEAMEQIKDRKVCIRLQAIISSANQPVNTVASVMGVSRHTLWRWIKRFRERGAEGVYDLPRGHNPAKLDAQKRRQIADWLKTGKNRHGQRTHWTLASLTDEVEQTFGIQVSIPSMWATVRGMGFRSKVPRPTHEKADPEAQERFKKNRRGS